MEMSGDKHAPGFLHAESAVLNEDVFIAPPANFAEEYWLFVLFAVLSLSLSRGFRIVGCHHSTPVLPNPPRFISLRCFTSLRKKLG